MELKQRVRIPVEINEVWHALNDPSVLLKCLPGCDRFEAVADNKFEVALTAKVGPVKAKFTGDVELSDVQPPNSYVISGSGKGGVAGFAKGSATVQLEPLDGNATLMTYGVNAAVGGKLAQIGSRLVAGTARKMADDFFTGFVRTLSGNENLEVELETLEA